MWYGKDAYFTSGWNIMDGTLVIISIVDLLMSLISESSPRIFGILRVIFILIRSENSFFSVGYELIFFFFNWNFYNQSNYREKNYFRRLKSSKKEEKLMFSWRYFQFLPIKCIYYFPITKEGFDSTISNRFIKTNSKNHVCLLNSVTRR